MAIAPRAAISRRCVRMTTTAPPRRTPLGHASPPRGIDETDISTEQQTTETHTRLSGSHEHRGRPAGAEAAARQGPHTPDGQRSSETTTLTCPGRQRLPKPRRIRKRAEFLRAERVGKRRTGTRFVVLTAPRTDGVSRLGITASRRVGGAVVRNRVKRLVREFFRRHQHRLSPAQDVLVIARPSAAQATYLDVQRELAAVLGLLEERNCRS